MGPRDIAAASIRSVRSVLSGSTEPGASRSSLARPGSSESGSTASGSDSENDGDDDDSDLESESVFIYTRVTRLPPTFFRKDPVSACLISSEAHVYGTHSGIVHLARPDSTPIRTVRIHRSSVLDISDSEGGFVATASIDGTVVITSIDDPTDLVQASFRRPVHAVSLHPDYKSFRSYVSGGTAGQVILSERGWLKTRSDTVLAQTQSTILAICWAIPSRLFWCNADGITCFNPETRNTIHRVSRPPGASSAELFKPRFHLFGNTTMVVCWHKTIYIINLDDGQLVSSIECSSTLAGAIPFHSIRQFVVLAVDKVPELKLINGDNGQETYEDELELNGGPRLTANDYHLYLAEPGKLYIVSAGDAVIARERRPRDHVDWLVEHHRFYDAYAASKQSDAEVEADERKKIGIKAAEQLVSDAEGKWSTAAYVLSEILDKENEEDRPEWLLWSNQFLNAGHQLEWGDVIPPIELNGVHDAVLDAVLEMRNFTKLRQWIKAWPLNVFNGRELANKLEAVATESSATIVAPSTVTDDAAAKAPSPPQDPTLLHITIAELWLKLDEYVKSVQHFVIADSSRAFGVAKHYHLWTDPGVVNMLGKVLSSGDGEDGTGGYVDRLRELINCRAEITPSRVVHQLLTEEQTQPSIKDGDSPKYGEQQHNEGGQDLLLFGYLTELGLVDETWLGEFADLMVKLYAKYDPEKLLGFLERFDSYNIDDSIKLCREKGLDNELVYLLGRVGRAQESLDIMIQKLGDYEHAVTFARGQGPEIWDYLVSYCSEQPGLVLELLKCVEVSPARVLAMVPQSMHIKGLKQALCKVLNNQEVSLELHSGALEIVRSESLQWTQMLRSLRLKGTEVDDVESLSWDEPLLISQEGHEKAKSNGPVSTFSEKINHLKWILGL